MKATLKPDFILHSIANEKVLIGAGQQIDFSKMLMLNDTAAWIIAELQKQPATPEELTLRLTEIYDAETAFFQRSTLVPQSRPLQAYTPTLQTEHTIIYSKIVQSGKSFFVRNRK